MTESCNDATCGNCDLCVAAATDASGAVYVRWECGHGGWDDEGGCYYCGRCGDCCECDR